MPPAPRPEEQVQSGALFAGRYQIEELIGQGGMGAVYRARDINLGETVALKILPVDPAAFPALALRFRQEVRLARRVTHPNVVRVHDLGEEQGLLYLTMELLDGQTLRSVLRAEGRLSPVRAASIARAVVEGLRAAHAAGVIHRDLKPSNVLVDRSGRVVLSDFGIARGVAEEQQLTQGPIGTPNYMAPEQATSGPMDERTDVYAVGLLLHEMLTGARPSGGPAEIAARLSGVAASPALAQLVLRCLAFRPEDRPRSAEEIARALDQAVPDLEDGATRALDAARAGAPEGQAPPTSQPRTDRTLAVLPFRYRGPKEQDYLGDALSDELVDVLSRTRGLRVLGSGVTARYRDARDPLLIGRELRAFAVIDGTLQVMGDRVRTAARLLDAGTGVQIWSDNHEGGLSDAFAFQESIARKVAESLRVELTTRVHGEAAPSEAIERYLAARRELRAMDGPSAHRAVELLEQAIALAPAFSPALAAHAIACTRAWFFSLDAVGGRDWEAEALIGVTRALERAPDVPESHLAAAMIATQRGDFHSAAAALGRALAIAPTFADAHEYLGTLQCEGGLTEQGLRHLRLAAELDPTLSYCALFQARYHALRGEWEQCEAAVAEFERRRGRTQVQYTLANMARFSAWRGDREALRALGSDLRLPDTSYGRLVKLYIRGASGEVSPEEFDAVAVAALDGARSPRLASLFTQIWAEVCALQGRYEDALRHVARAAGSVLIDVDWLERCPLFAPLRDRPEMVEARRLVRARADAIWSP